MKKGGEAGSELGLAKGMWQGGGRGVTRDERKGGKEYRWRDREGGTKRCVHGV